MGMLRTADLAVACGFVAALAPGQGEAPAADALPTAHARALRLLIERDPAGAWRDSLERALKTVPASPSR
jgi:hypothetical protein